MNLRVTAAAAALLVAASTATAPAPADARRADPVHQGVHVVGDSITHAVHRYVLDGRGRPDRWTVDGMPGRRVTALGRRYVHPTREVMSSYHRRTGHIFAMTPRRSKVRTIVLALGTNGADHDMTVREAAALYAKSVRVARSRGIWDRGPKRIVLVTPWKDPAITDGAYNARTDQPYHQSKWHEKGEVYRAAIWRVARNSSGVCVMDWASYVETHPRRLPDGIHPDQLGRKVWRNMLFRTIRECHA